MNEQKIFLKRAYTTIKLDSSQSHKKDSTHTSQSMWPSTSTTEKTKPNKHLHRHRKSISWNSASIHHENSSQTGYGGDTSQHNKSYVEPAQEKSMATHSCLENPMDGGAWRLQSMGLRRVRHDWATSLSLFTFMHWRRQWQPAPVFLPGESQGRQSLVGCCLWGHTESDMTEAT